MKNFEKELTEMTKPQINQLKHRDLLTEAILKARDKSVLSWWWLSIPLYIILALLMKSFFMPQTSLISSIHELAGREKYMSLFFFFIVPVIFIIINLLSIRKIYFLSGNPRSIRFLQTIWFNIFIIILSIIILIFYLL